MYQYLRVRLKTSARITKLSQHEADGGEFQEREGVAVESFPVLGEAALLRFYVLHCIGLPFIIMIFMIVHFWRIRKDGGISGPT